MKQRLYPIGLLLIIVNCFVGCQQFKSKDYLVMITDTINDKYGYRNFAGDTIIPLGKYVICYTDTLKKYAIVLKPKDGFVAIDRNEKILYKIFPFDNGPDYTSDGIYRILENDKIGYADSLTGKIIIKPQFRCAFPFKNGVAKVSYEGETKNEGEYHKWISNNWFFIDKAGTRKRLITHAKRDCRNLSNRNIF